MTIHRLIVPSLLLACLWGGAALPSLAAAETPPPMTWTAVKGKSSLKTQNGTMAVTGTIISPCVVRDLAVARLSADVQFLVPEISKDWDSTSLILRDRQHGQTLGFTALLKSPKLAANEMELSINNQSRCKIKAPRRGIWYRLKVELTDGVLTLRVWPAEAQEPERPHLTIDVPTTITQFDELGISASGSTSTIKEPIVTCAKPPPPEAFRTLGNDMVRARLCPNGSLKTLEFKRAGTWVPIEVRIGSFRGPAWTTREASVTRDLVLTAQADGTPTYAATDHDITYRLAYHVEDARLVIDASLTNQGTTAFTPEWSRLRLGIDLEMVSYPSWNDKYSPTLLRCEKTHFWGYLMSPKGNILGVSSPDPVASYTTHYSGGGHRIYSASLDLLHQAPLPARHPQDLAALPAGASRTWRIVLEDLPDLAAVKPALAHRTAAPMISCDRYTVAEGGSVDLSVWSDSAATATLIGPTGQRTLLPLTVGTQGLHTAHIAPADGIGLYTLEVANGAGKVSQAQLSVRHPWSWYVNAARKEAVAIPQIACNNIEGWYGLFTAYMARRVIPAPALDAAIDERFREIWPLMYSLDKFVPIQNVGRAQNHSGAAELMVHRYRATGDIKDLEFASGLADFVIKSQSSDGAYRAGSAHYTSVIYVAKNILTVAMAEAEAGATDPRWAAKAKEHFASVERAIDDLAKRGDNIGTEGEATYEDGMIACSYTQLALFALQQTDPVARKNTLEAALRLKDGHRCLSQLLIPDSRMNGGSLRYWESQYDVLMKPNMMNSPHGWSAWRVYGLWYLYLLTGEEDYMRQVENTLGSCAQLIDFTTGELRWAFVPDPSIEALVFAQDSKRPGKGIRQSRTIGEQYIPMIGRWHTAAPNSYVSGYSDRDGGSCNNDVHEIFKCIGEVMLENAHVLERADGTIVAWNCSVQEEPAGRLTVTPSDKTVSRVHFNLRNGHKVKVLFSSGAAEGELKAGMGWFGPGGEPFEVRRMAGNPGNSSL